MRDDEQAGLSRIDTGCDLACTLEKQFGHRGMISNRLTVLPRLPVRSFCCGAIQLQLARDYRLSEVAFADEIWHDADFTDRFRIEQKLCIAQARFLFPKRTFDICKDFATPNLRGVRQCRRTRVRVHRRAVCDDEKSAYLRISQKKRSIALP